MVWDRKLVERMLDGESQDGRSLYFCMHFSRCCGFSTMSLVLILLYVRS
jgi:hypothetical protein